MVEAQTPSFYGLLEGSIDVFKDIAGREERIFTSGPGDSFGEVPLLLGAPVFANLRAAEPCRLVRLEGTDFLQLVSQCQVLSSEITRTLVARVSHISRFRAQHPAVVATVIGHAQDAAGYELRNFLSLKTGFRSPGSSRGTDPSRPASSSPTALGWRTPASAAWPRRSGTRPNPSTDPTT